MTNLTAISTFSGVGGLDRGLEMAGIVTAAQAEKDDWRRLVLEAHFPGVERYADVRDMAESYEGARPRRGGTLGAGHDRGDAERARPGPAWQHARLLHGGFPCQDLSVAGKRAGLAGARSGLFHEFARIADAVRPTWVLLENVPGLLTSNDGRDFGIVLGALAELGYGVAWRVLDARYFGVPQRRRRVFVVGHLGGDRRSALLALCESCEGGPAAGRCSWQDDPAGAPGGPGSGLEESYYVEDQVNGTLRANGHGGSRTDKQPMVVGALQAPKNGPRFAADDAAAGHLIAHALHGHHNRHGADTDTLVAAPKVASTLTRGGAATPGVSAPGRRKEDDFNLVTAGTLRSHPRPGSNSDGAIVPFSVTPIDGQGSELAAVQTDVATGIDRGMAKSSDRGMRLVEPEVGVRRLIPVECERLMAWPDRWTAPEGIEASDSRRYAACGDGVVSNVAEWLGRRIVAVDEMNGGRDDR